MKAEIEVIEDKIYYSIPELEIDMDFTEKNGELNPGFFTDEASEEYWSANWEKIEKEVMDYLDSDREDILFVDLTQMNKIDFQRDQPLLSIRSNGQERGWIEAKDGKLVTTGEIGENTYENFVELIKGLQGKDIKIDDFYW
jgi:hypothetical protein